MALEEDRASEELISESVRLVAVAPPQLLPHHTFFSRSIIPASAQPSFAADAETIRLDPKRGVEGRRRHRLHIARGVRARRALDLLCAEGAYIVGKKASGCVWLGLYRVNLKVLDEVPPSPCALAGSSFEEPA